MNIGQKSVKLLLNFLMMSLLSVSSFSAVQKPLEHSSMPQSAKNKSTTSKNTEEKIAQKSLSPTQKREQFYQNRSGVPVWLQDDGLTEAGKNALSALQNADLEGLNASIYQPIVKIISDLNFKNLSSEDLMKNDDKMTQYVILYLEDLEGERLPPEKVNKELHLKVKDIDSYVILSEGMTQDPTGKWLTSYSLAGREYQDLKKLLAAYRDIQRQGGWPTLDLPASVKLEEGKSHPLIKVLKKQLFIQGDLQQEDPDTPIFTPDLLAALKQFQRRHGLEEDGKLGPETRQALNVPIDARIQQILVSMERWRWAPAKKPDERSVMVNIAGYYLQAFEGDRKVLDMPVIIGQSFQKTPVFMSEIDIVRFNPSWHVPHSIAVKDKLPLLRSKPSYFKAKGYVIYDANGSPVDAEDVNWASVEASNFDYKIVQNPGDANALGKLFFHINTPFDVFLHGTPDVDLFKKAKRSFSSGCIRLQDPAALAQFVLQNDPKWTKEAIAERLTQKGTQDIIPHPFVNIYVTYQTVWVDDNNLAHFMDDFYGQDKTIETALKIQEASQLAL